MPVDVMGELEELTYISVRRFVESALKWVNRYAPKLGRKMEGYWRRARRGDVMRCPLAYVLWAFQYVCNAGFMFGLGEDAPSLEEQLKAGSAYFSTSEEPDLDLAREVYVRAVNAFKLSQAYMALKYR